MALRVSERSFDRVVNFSDAVVAIALTLLVLPLTDLAGPDEERSAIDLIRANGGVFHAFILSFFLVSIYWIKHHKIWGYIKAYDPFLLWINLAWLMLIVLLPFASGLIAEHGFGSGSGSIYLGLMAGISVLLGLMTKHVSTRPSLQNPPIPPEFFSSSQKRSIAFTTFFVVLAALAPFIPNAVGWLMVLLIPLSLWRRRKEDFE